MIGGMNLYMTKIKVKINVPISFVVTGIVVKGY